MMMQKRTLKKLKLLNESFCAFIIVLFSRVYNLLSLNAQWNEGKQVKNYFEIHWKLSVIYIFSLLNLGKK